MKKLFKIDSKKKERVWQIWTEGSKVIQEAGLIDGKLVRHETVCKTKNAGRSNETTPEEQAILEMESTYKSKLDEGYFKTLKEANSEEVILPTLAKDYKKEKDKVDWTTAFCQRKFDGMRCLAFVKAGIVTLMSRGGKVIENMDHIKKAILENVKGDMILDGELWMDDNFQENMKAIKKYTKGVSEKIQYHIYDFIPQKPNVDLSFEDRHEALEHVIKKTGVLQLVETFQITDENLLKKYHRKFVSEGFEGTMIRWGLVGYPVNKRSSNLLKYKDFQDMALKILAVVPSEQRPTWGQFVFMLKGMEFSCGMKFSHTEREEILKNKKDYIGKTAELRYFELSEDGIPRFPVCVGVRLDK